MNISHLINRRSTTIALLISLLLHIGMALYLALEKSLISLPLLPEAEQHNELLKKEEPLKKDTEWVETKGRNGGFGADVIFRDEPDEEIIPDLSIPKPIGAQQNTVPDEQNNNYSADKTIPENYQEKQTPTQKTEAQESLKKESTPTSIAESLDVTQLASRVDKTTPTPKKAYAPAESNPPRMVPLITATSSYRQNSPHAAVSKPITLQKKPLSLAQLTQGVLNYVREEGSHAVTMLGKKNGTPSDEQMKYERYLQKLNWCLQNSFVINNDRFPLCDPSINSIHVFLSLNKDGTLHNLKLAKTSGDARVDAFIMFAFRDASSSFPPVPHYLPHNPFSITYAIEINAEHKNIGMYRR